MTLKTEPWPHGLSEEIAVVDTDVERIERSLNMSFFEDHDDLDYYKYQLFSVDGRRYALMRYRNAPGKGMTIIVDKSNVDDKGLLDRILKNLNLPDTAILWERDYSASDRSIF